MYVRSIGACFRETKERGPETRKVLTSSRTYLRHSSPGAMRTSPSFRSLGVCHGCTGCIGRTMVAKSSSATNPSASLSMRCALDLCRIRPVSSQLVEVLLIVKRAEGNTARLRIGPPPAPRVFQQARRPQDCLWELVSDVFNERRRQAREARGQGGRKQEPL